MSRTALVTGSSGFLGSKVKALLLDRGYQVISIDRSSTPQFPNCVSIIGDLATLDLPSCIPHEGLSACFHFAGASSVPRSWDNPLEDFSAGLPGTLNLILFLAKHHPNCPLHVSSSAAVYGNPVTLPIPESAPIAPISPYGIHKALIEQLCFSYSHLYSVPVRILRIFSAYGSGLRRQLLWDTTQKILDSVAKQQSTISLWGTGSETRDFIHAADVATSALCIADANLESTYEVFNVASGIQTRIRDVVTSVCDHWGGSITPLFGGETRLGDPMQWCADISKLTSIGYKPSLSLDQGIKDYVDWVKNVC